MITTISILNPIHIFSLAEDVYEYHDSVIPLDPLPSITSQAICDLAVTFNTEDKNDVVKDFKPYYHKVAKGDVTLITVEGEDDMEVIKYSILDATGRTVSTDSLAYIVDSTTKYSADLSSIWAGLDDYTKYRLIIWDETAGWLRGISDLFIIVPEGLTRSVVITYSNGASIDYADAYFQTEFQFRVDASFMREESPEEIVADKYANGNAVNLTSSIKTTRKLQVLPVPEYIHKKIKTLLKCTSVYILTKQYVQEEAYEVKWLEENHEFGRGNVVLTEQNSTIRNVFKV